MSVPCTDLRGRVGVGSETLLKAATSCCSVFRQWRPYISGHLYARSVTDVNLPSEELSSARRCETKIQVMGG